MRTFRQMVLYLRIEYHWHRILHLKKRQEKKKSERLFYCENLHRFHAKRLGVIYEISLGIRDTEGNIIA